jgi:ubiquinone/menaquinone biosynthesis C-methylase UbiE
VSIHRGWECLIRLAFWVLYNPLAWAYDRVSRIVSMGQWHGWQRAGLIELRGKYVLELASGTGDMLLELCARQQYHPVGIDLSRPMVHIAQQKLARHRVSVPLVQGRCQRLPFADTSFDAVLSTFPTEFIIAPDTLCEIARVLRPGGRAVIVVMAQFLPDGPGTWFLEALYRIAGQRRTLPNLEPYVEVLGLTYHTMRRAVDGASVLLAILEKQVDGSQSSL